MVFKLDNYIKSFGFLVIGVLISIFLGATVWLWTINASNEFIKKNEDLINLSSKRSNLIYTKRVQENISSNKEKVLKSFASEEKLVDFIVFLEDIAKDTGNTIDIGTVDNKKESQDGLFTFKIVLAGGYPEFINFLDRLENSFYLVRTKKLDFFETVDSVNKAKIFKANLELEVLAI